MRHFSTLFLLLLTLLIVEWRGVSLSWAAAPTGDSSACKCNNGVVLRTEPLCQCHCFDQYLLPSCLYRATDTVPINIWLRQRTTDTTRCTFAGDDLVRALSNAFGCDASLITFVRAQSAHNTGSDGIILHRAVAEVPGWVAQQLLADVANSNTGGYGFTASMPDCSEQSFALLAVMEKETAPHTLPRYDGEWLRMYMGAGSTGWYASLPQYGWLLGAALLMAVCVTADYCCLFNIELNVGGGGAVLLADDKADEDDNAEDMRGTADDIAILATPSRATSARQHTSPRSMTPRRYMPVSDTSPRSISPRRYAVPSEMKSPSTTRKSHRVADSAVEIEMRTPPR